MNNNIVSTCAILAATAAFCPFALSAMPTRAELKEAQPIVSELMAADVAALKAGKTDAKAVAEKALGYAEEASTDAAKYLLLQGAFYNYTNAKDYDKAAETVDKLRETIPDMEPKALSAMIAKALRKGRAAGRLSEMLEELERETRYARLMSDVDAELKSKPKDSKLLQMSAEYHALTGDWKDALPKFEQLGGKFADVVTFEKGKSSKLTAAEVGDFWWGYPVAGEGEEAMNGFKRHAVRFYRQALQNSNFKGLKRTIVEKRLAALGGTAATVGTASAGEQPKAVVTKLAEGARPENLTFKLDDKTDFVMVGCPAGKCDAWTDPKWQYWPVPFTISRPFWYAAVPTTFGQWIAFRPQTKIPELAQKFAGFDGMIHATPAEVELFCDWLNKKFKARLPKGYVFRLPTMAEWQYACAAGTGDMRIYARRVKAGDVEVGRKYAREKGVELTDDQLKKLLDPWSDLCARPVRRTEVNEWGIFDASEISIVLDVFVEGVTGRRTAKKGRGRDLFGLTGTVALVDPLLYPKRNQMPKDKTGMVNLLRCDFWAGTAYRESFRIVLGPDLLKERGLAK